MTKTREEIQEEAKFNIRPQYLTDFIGQELLKQNLAVLIGAALVRGEVLDHILFYGPPGLGKTTLALIIANEMRTNCHITTGPMLKKVEDLAGILTKLSHGDIFFVDEIHRLRREVEEVLYPAMEDRVLDILVGKGKDTKMVRLPINPFTLIGATTRRSMLTAPMRARFGAVYRMDYYDLQSICQIVYRSAKVLGVTINNEAAIEIANRSRGTPRTTNMLLRRVRDYAQFLANGHITTEVVLNTMEMINVDNVGLDWLDRKVLEIIINQFNGGPVGLDTLASMVSEETDTINSVVEPYLLRLGFIERTTKGRIATQAGYEHLGIPYTNFDKW